MASSNIIQALPSDTPDFQTRELGQKYHNWILRQFQSGLSQFQYQIKEPQIALEALGCLSQCVAWHITGHLLAERIVNEILQLGIIYLPCNSRMRGFHAISAQFDRKLELIERAFDLCAATDEDIQELKAWFLEIARS
jgi:hypothetical protein